MKSKKKDNGKQIVEGPSNIAVVPISSLTVQKSTNNTENNAMAVLSYCFPSPNLTPLNAATVIETEVELNYAWSLSLKPVGGGHMEEKEDKEIRV